MIKVYTTCVCISYDTYRFVVSHVSGATRDRTSDNQWASTWWLVNNLVVISISLKARTVDYPATVGTASATFRNRGDIHFALKVSRLSQALIFHTSIPFLFVTVIWFRLKVIGDGLGIEACHSSMLRGQAKFSVGVCRGFTLVSSGRVHSVRAKLYASSNVILHTIINCLILIKVNLGSTGRIYSGISGATFSALNQTINITLTCRSGKYIRSLQDAS